MDYLLWGQLFFVILALLIWFIFWMFAGYYKKKNISEIIVPSLYVFPYFFGVFFIFFLLTLYIKYKVH